MTFVDEWAAKHMWVTRGLEPGPYRIERTPYAREPMRCLSLGHRSKRVVVMAASGLMKTQVAINWIGSLVHTSPSNLLVLLPTRPLAMRFGMRMDESIKASHALYERFAARGERCSRSFEGGSLRLVEAGSLVAQSFPADYVFGEQIDHWPAEDVDLIELAERCHDTSVRKPKFYFTGTPTIKGASRIDSLFLVSDQQHYYVPCPHCGHMQTLEWERLQYSLNLQAVHYQCVGPGCGLSIAEHHRTEMLARGRWVPHAKGDGETYGFHLNSLYAPSGWKSWACLAKGYEWAKKQLLGGDPVPMQIFYNVELAKVWDCSLG